MISEIGKSPFNAALDFAWKQLLHRVPVGEIGERVCCRMAFEFAHLAIAVGDDAVMAADAF